MIIQENKAVYKKLGAFRAVLTGAAYLLFSPYQSQEARPFASPDFPAYLQESSGPLKVGTAGDRGHSSIKLLYYKKKPTYPQVTVKA